MFLAEWRQWRRLLADDPIMAADYVNYARRGDFDDDYLAGHMVYRVIAAGLGKNANEVDFKTLDRREAVLAVLPKNKRASFDWDEFEWQMRIFDENNGDLPLSPEVQRYTDERVYSCPIIQQIVREQEDQSKAEESDTTSPAPPGFDPP